MKFLYAWLLPNAFADKRCVETIVHHAIGKEYDGSQIPGSNILPEDWKKRPSTCRVVEGFCDHPPIHADRWSNDEEIQSCCRR